MDTFTRRQQNEIVSDRSEVNPVVEKIDMTITTTITLDLTDVQKLAIIALPGLKAERERRVAKVKAQLAAKKEEYDSLPWWKQLFATDPGTTPTWHSDLYYDAIRACKDLTSLDEHVGRGHARLEGV